MQYSNYVEGLLRESIVEFTKDNKYSILGVGKKEYIKKRKEDNKRVIDLMRFGTYKDKTYS